MNSKDVEKMIILLKGQENFITAQEISEILMFEEKTIKRTIKKIKDKYNIKSKCGKSGGFILDK